MSGVELTTSEEHAAAEEVAAALRAERVDVGQGDVPAPRRETPTEKRDRLAREQEEREAEDFSRFWAAQRRRGKVLRNVVPGVDVELPPSLPLAFEIEARRLADDRTLAAVHRIFSLLYGEDTLAKLIAGGLDIEQLQVLIVWGSANASGRDMSLGEAHAEYLRLRARSGEQQGKGLLATVTSGPPSSGTGRSSKPTSRASTGSRKRRSRR